MFRRKRRVEAEHSEIDKRLSQQEQDLEKMGRRVRLLEIEAGIFKPQLKEVNGQ